jgi:hypothetical protein
MAFEKGDRVTVTMPNWEGSRDGIVTSELLTGLNHTDDKVVFHWIRIEGTVDDYLLQPDKEFVTRKV